MIPYYNLEGTRATDDGLGRLLRDLQIIASEDVVVPAAVRKNVFARIDSEPARVETDPSGYIVATNPAFSKLCGYSFSEIRGKKPGSFLQGELTEPEPVEVLRKAIRTKSAVTVELTNYHKDGTPYRVRISIEPIFDDSGVHRGFRATEQKLN